MSNASDDAILFADDDDTTRQLGRTLLERMGFAVVLASDGYDALRLFHRHRMSIALLFFDVRMPKLAGPQLLEALRRIDPAVPALLTSACEEHDLQRLATRFTYTNYLVKPWDLARLEQLVVRSIEQCPTADARRQVGRVRVRSSPHPSA